jgi:hypothetical protein
VAPWIFGVVIIPVAVAMFVLRLRILRNTRDKVKEGRADWNDEWDPFQ